MPLSLSRAICCSKLRRTPSACDISCQRKRLGNRALDSRDARLAIATGAIMGAALGAKRHMAVCPSLCFQRIPSWRHLLEGKPIIGALLGGLLEVEAAKKSSGIKASTGNALGRPLALGMIIGRVVGSR